MCIKFIFWPSSVYLFVKKNLSPMYLIKTPQFLQNLFPNLVWRMPTEEKVLFFTFDDGPIPEVTPWVLDILAEFDAKATFFCVGDNIHRYPEVFRKVLEAGHTVGNHTYNHLNGWRTELEDYLFNVARCANLMVTNLFRPPYGRLRPKQSAQLQHNYEIVMWDVLSGDFDNELDGEQCYQNIIQNARPGSIIVMHDSLKAEANLRYALPKALAYFKEIGYTFASVPDRNAQAAIAS